MKHPRGEKRKSLGKILRLQVFLLAALLLFCGLPIGLSSFLEGYQSISSYGMIVRVPPLHAEGRYIKDSNGKIVHLRGVNKPSFEWNPNGERMDEQQFAYAQDWGVNIVRLPFKMDWMIADESYRQRIYAVIARAENYGMYVILDCHSYGTPSNVTAWINMWKMLAQRCLGKTNVLFDIFNEPHSITDEQWRTIAQQCVDAIRTINPDVLIVISANGWGNAPVHWVQTTPITGGNIIYSLHWYPSSTPIPKPYTVEGIKTWLVNKGWKAILDNGVAPVIVGEFGANPARDPDDLIWLDCLLKVTYEWEMQTMYWSWWEEGTSMCGLLTHAWDGTPSEAGQIYKDFLALGAR